jgi:hypothetical protein
MKKIYASSLFILILTIICKDSSGQPGQNLTPQSNNRFDIGAAANRWRTLYVNNIDALGKVNIGGTLSVTGTTSLGGLQVQGPATFTGNLSSRGATFNTLSTQSFQVTGGTVAAGSVLTSDASGVATWQQPQPATGFWSLTGNAGTVDGTNFIGTTDNVPLTVKVNGRVSGRIDQSSTLLGYSAGGAGSNSELCTAIGAFALNNNTSGLSVAIGYAALTSSTIGADNTAVGTFALGEISTGNLLTGVGYEAQTSSDGLSNSTAIGGLATITASNQVVLGNTNVTTIGGYANWTNFSDGRYKRNIKQNVPGLAFITQLQPITYTLDISGIDSKLHSNSSVRKGPDGRPIPKSAWEQTAIDESSNIIHTGFIAQDVEKTAMKLGYDFSGVDKPKDDSKSFYGLRYGDFVVPLVKAVQELSGKNDSMVAIVSQLKDSLAQMNDRLTKIEQSLGLGNSSAVSLNSAKLFQNAPNPFNQITHISYYIPQSSGNATIMVTDINGRNIKSVPITVTGNGQISLQTAQLTAGTYVYSLYVDGNLIDTKKMVLTK